MGKVRVFPSTQEQVAAVDAKLDIVNSKLPLPIYQAKAATPSDELQIITPDSGYSALSSVSVVPISALMPESLNEYILRTATDYFSLHLSGNIPASACYGQNKLIHVYGNATSIGNGAFQNCSSLQEIDLRNATSIGNNAFLNCPSLQEIDSRNATSIGSSAFERCSSLQEIDLRNATSIGNGAFQNCSSLQEIDSRNATSIGSSAFERCSSLQEIDLRNATSIGNNAFLNCSSLQEIDLRNATSISGYAFQNCSSLQLIDLTSRTTPTTLTNTGVFTGTNSTWIAVVANDTIKSDFQNATNWSTFASHFRTIAEVEAEVGMTYDEYYLQIFGHARNEVTP